jgi:hypothetical protein
VQLIDRLNGAPVAVRTFTALEKLDEGGARLCNVLASTTEEVSADRVIIVGERRARAWSGLIPAGARVQVIGDALVPGVSPTRSRRAVPRQRPSRAPGKPRAWPDR